MRKNDFAQVLELDVKSLKLKVKTFREELQSLIFDKSQNKLKDKKAIFKKRKDLARVLTVIAQKELVAELEKKVNK